MSGIAHREGTLLCEFGIRRRVAGGIVEAADDRLLAFGHAPADVDQRIGGAAGQFGLAAFEENFTTPGSTWKRATSTITGTAITATAGAAPACAGAVLDITGSSGTIEAVRH